MGIYLNPANNGYSETKNGKVFVDKSLLIDYTNQVIKTPQKNICVSRPRRFGKSTDANMLVAYYSKGCDSSQIYLFTFFLKYSTLSINKDLSTYISLLTAS